LTRHIIDNPHKLEVEEERIPLSFHLSISDNQNNETIPIFVLHGFGEYSDSEYMKSLHASLTKQYNVMIITVNYVGTFSKVSNSKINEDYEFINYSINLYEGENKDVYLKLLMGILNDPSGMSKYFKERNALKDEIELSNYIKLINLLIAKIENNLCDGLYVIEMMYVMGFNTTIASFFSSTQGDHQDFGLIQAIDVLTVLAFIKNKNLCEDINWSKLSIVGTSHGAYIGSMCDKIAPNTFHVIVDNAGWISPFKNFFKDKMQAFANDMKYQVYEDNYWSDNNKRINFFSSHHQEIRTLSNKLHMLEQSQQTILKNSKHYVFSHTINDHLISIKDKDEYLEELDKYEYDIEYIRLDKSSNLMGKTFKSLDHGADASLKGLVIDFIINNSYIKNSKISKNDIELNSKIKYTCSNGVYVIDYTNKFPKLSFVNQKQI
jgi:hypothetical protein